MTRIYTNPKLWAGREPCNRAAAIGPGPYSTPSHGLNGGTLAQPPTGLVERNPIANRVGHPAANARYHNEIVDGLERSMPLAPGDDSERQ
jgi:hypothetical protein